MTMRRCLDVAQAPPVAEEKAEKCARVHVWEVEGQDARPSQPSHGLHVLVFSLSVSNILFAGLCLFLYLDAQCPISNARPSRTPSGYASSDFPSAISAIKYEAREFAGLTEHNSIHLTPGTDKEWIKFDRDTIFALIEREAMPFLRDGLSKDTSTNRYYGELSVFHSLKCFNVIRTELNSNQYRMKEDAIQEELALPQSRSSAHLEYCLEHLRQTIQCSADLTLVPMVKDGTQVDGKGVLVAGRQKHSCRNWESVRNWVDERSIVGKTFDGLGAK
ncbi:hypothetical protein K490DRAFT_52868 [Saccharata proteae CBS 121410]|uniref:Uncharacterized protein n=1 Tax=Saccharata proteae CBS 121410 TaxID=1314787 RepID=A0A9P4LZR0_9PEZI|nr:hypothetical protein K490DRAFT_52868 [Saccharata proteae CBS 121410]